MAALHPADEHGASNQYLPVGLQDQRVHEIVGVRIEARVEAAVGLEAREPVACLSAHGRKCPSDDHLAIGLHGEGQDATGKHTGRESGVDAAIRLDSGNLVAYDSAHCREAAADQDLPVGLHRNAIDDAVRIGIESGIQAAVCLKTGNPVARHPAHSGEGATKDHFPISLDHKAEHLTIHVGIERGVETAIGQETGDAVASHASHRGEGTRDQHPIISLHGDAGDHIVGRRVEARVESAVRVNPGDSAACHPTHGRKVATNQDLAVGLHRDRSHLTIRVGIEAAIDVTGNGTIGRRGEGADGRVGSPCRIGRIAAETVGDARAQAGRHTAEAPRLRVRDHQSADTRPTNHRRRVGRVHGIHESTLSDGRSAIGEDRPAEAHRRRPGIAAGDARGRRRHHARKRDGRLLPDQTAGRVVVAANRTARGARLHTCAEGEPGEFPVGRPDHPHAGTQQAPGSPVV